MNKRQRKKYTKQFRERAAAIMTNTPMAMYEPMTLDSLAKTIEAVKADIANSFRVPPR